MGLWRGFGGAEGAPLIPPVDTDDAATRSSSSRRAAIALALVAVCVLITARRPWASSAVEAEEALAKQLDDYTDENGLYVCKNGVPSVPSAYSDGSWGNINGRWCARAPHAQYLLLESSYFQ
jgi:hypothetical protein